MRRPLIGYRNLWADFEKCILEVFVLALQKLHDKTTLPTDEDSVRSIDSLNRRLNFCLRDAIREWETINDIDIVATPKSNLAKQPDLENEELINDYERTKPDFQWEFIDKLGNSNNHNSVYKNYEIECKRLGKDLSAKRKLNEKYVSEGILRFTTNSHCYGQFTSSGLMIGYVQNTDLQIILNEVNSGVVSSSLPELTLSPKGWEKDVSRLDHKLDRPDIEPTPFELRHLWVDLRHHYQNQQPSSSPTKKASTRKKSTAQKPKSSKGRPNKDSSVAE